MLDGTKKYSMEKFGKKCFLLGQDKDGINYFLEAATWDCGWYWGGGYVKTYTSNRNPIISRDIETHKHFNGLFFNGGNDINTFKETLPVNPFTDSEIREICELMKSFYIAREYADMVYRGGAHYANNPAAEIIKSEDEYKRINNIVIPAIMESLYEVLEEVTA